MHSVGLGEGRKPRYFSSKRRIKFILSNAEKMSQRKFFSQALSFSWLTVTYASVVRQIKKEEKGEEEILT